MIPLKLKASIPISAIQAVSTVSAKVKKGLWQVMILSFIFFPTDRTYGFCYNFLQSFTYAQVGSSLFLFFCQIKNLICPQATKLGLEVQQMLHREKDLKQGRIRIMRLQTMDQERMAKVSTLRVVLGSSSWWLWRQRIYWYIYTFFPSFFSWNILQEYIRFTSSFSSYTNLINTVIIIISQARILWVALFDKVLHLYNNDDGNFYESWEL